MDFSATIDEFYDNDLDLFTFEQIKNRHIEDEYFGLFYGEKLPVFIEEGIIPKNKIKNLKIKCLQITANHYLFVTKLNNAEFCLWKLRNE